MPVWIRWLAVLLLGWAGAAAAAPLELDGRIDDVDACAGLTWRPGGGVAGRDVHRALADPAAFEPPDGPCGNYGRDADGVWLKVTLKVAADAVPRRWYLDVDYAPLQSLDVHLLRDGQAVWHAMLGDRLAHVVRPSALRSHAVPLPLHTAGEWTVLIKVESNGALIAPVRVIEERALLQRENHVLILQGVLSGMALMLALYGILHCVTLRDGSYLFYAMQVLAMSVFFLAYSGVGAQFLWPELGGWTAQAVRVSVLAGLAANAIFADRVLQMARVSPRVDRGLSWLALVCSVAAVTLLMGVMPGALAHRLILVVVPAAMLLYLAAGLAALRDDQSVARWVIGGWALLAGGVFVSIAAQWGLIESNFWTLNACQFGTVADMLAWLRVISLHGESLRIEAELARRERDRLDSMAHSDALTGALNRRGLERLGNALIAQAGPDAQVALFVVDLDEFKLVNDRHGHEAGDGVLVEMTRRMRQQLRSGDLVARLGGDEFVVVATALAGRQAAHQLAAKIAHALGVPLRVRNQTVDLSASIGVALAPEDGRDCATLIGLADDAMYRHKRAAKSGPIGEVREQV